MNYEERLKALDLTTLSERRQRRDMIQIFKIFHGIDILEIEYNSSFQNNQTRCHCFKHHREISRHTYVYAETVNYFKAGLDYWMSSNQAKQLSKCAKNTLTGFKPVTANNITTTITNIKV